MIKTKGLRHVNIKVSDLQRSIKFYEHVFGMEVQFWDGPSMVFLNTPGTQDLLTLTQAEEGEPVGMGGGFDHIGFSAQDKKDRPAGIQDVIDAGGSVVESGVIKDSPDLIYAYVADPDGYVIQL